MFPTVVLLLFLIVYHNTARVDNFKGKPSLLPISAIVQPRWRGVLCDYVLTKDNIYNSWFPVSGFWFPVSGFWFLVSGFWFLVSGFRFLVSGFWIHTSGFWIQVLGFWFLGSGSWFLASGFRFPFLGFWDQDYGSGLWIVVPGSCN